ncbi:hypothetical protein ABVK25_008726 [Lepraria finkii]|uniref:Uncharacterized protein n=1 Tax=Lepraria finkii TaxID=1340010 RepID=A0ABR4AZR8_9LECA
MWSENVSRRLRLRFKRRRLGSIISMRRKRRGYTLIRIGPELFAQPPTPRKRVRRPQLIVILRVGKRGLHYMEQVEHMEHAGYDMEHMEHMEQMEQMEHMKQAEHAEQYTSRHGRQIKKTYKATT